MRQRCLPRATESGETMTTVVDARGKPCPQPVIETRKALASSDDVLVIVDNETSRHNVSRMCERQGYQVSAETQDDGIHLHVTRSQAPTEAVASQGADRAPMPAGGPSVVLVASEAMGRGEHPELGQVLMRAFFHTLTEVEPKPDTIIFLNSGVKLVIEGSPVLEDLRALSEGGTEIFACGTCLGYYELTERIAVGEVSNMYTIAETLLGAGCLVTL